jgi:surfeit locus 1 family protein
MIKIARYTLRFHIVTTLAYLVVMSLLIFLGTWQLHRAEQKRQLLNSQVARSMAETVRLSSTSEDNVDVLRYKKVEVAGHYDVQHQFLIDNQMSAGKAGYLVLTPFILEEENQAVLVNRGWIPLTQDRSILPDVKIERIQGVIKGRINSFPSVGLKLPGAELPTDSWPSIVQVVDSEVLAKRLGYSLFHFQIELDKESPEGYKRDWQLSHIMPPEQHTAYAAQWFALALTLSILFVVYSIKKEP